LYELQALLIVGTSYKLAPAGGSWGYLPRVKKEKTVKGR